MYFKNFTTLPRIAVVIWIFNFSFSLLYLKQQRASMHTSLLSRQLDSGTQKCKQWIAVLKRPRAIWEVTPSTKGRELQEGEDEKEEQTLPLLSFI